METYWTCRDCCVVTSSMIFYKHILMGKRDLRYKDLELQAQSWNGLWWYLKVLLYTCIAWNVKIPIGEKASTS